MREHVVVPWCDEKQIEKFVDAWSVGSFIPDWLILQHDEHREGCAVTKNKGIKEALRRGADIVVVLDDDCFPHGNVQQLSILGEMHRKALEPQQIKMFETVTVPPSRGTPYENLTVEMPVAASMGFWTEIGDYCAVRQLSFGTGEMEPVIDVVYGRFFPLCGMNLAFRPKEWMPWCNFIDVPRFDDIWMGWMWQREAYRKGYCFNLSGPVVQHSRQSNVWKNLAAETTHLQENEILWQKIFAHPENDYDSLKKLLPKDMGGSDR